MAVIALTAAKVAAPIVYEQVTLPAGVDVTAGQVVRWNLSNGTWALAQATTAANAANSFIALTTAKAGMPCTAIKSGYLNLGTALDGMALGDSIYLSDTAGALDTAAGTVNVLLGKVAPAFGNGAAFDRLMRVQVPV
jgi:hypothetical protein